MCLEAPGEGEAHGGLRIAAHWVKQRWMPIVMAGVIIAAFIVRIYYFNRHTVYPTDSYYYMVLARSLSFSLSYTVRGFTHTKYLPGYPLLIMLFSFVFRDVSRAAGYVVALAGVFSVLFTYWIGKELLGEMAGFLGGIILAFQPAFLKWTSLPVTEGIFTLCFTAGLYYCLTGCMRASRVRRLTGAALGGFSLLIRWEGALFFPLVVLIVALYWKDSRFALWEIPAMFALYAVPIGIFVLRNVLITGKVSSYFKEYSSNNEEETLGVLFLRFRRYAWGLLQDKVLMVVFYAGALVALVRKYKAFLILFGWFLIFAVFHAFWFYVYDRFLVPAAPAVAILAGYFLYSCGALAEAAYRERNRARSHFLEKGKRAAAAAAEYGLVAFRYAAIIVLVAAFSFMMYHEVVRAGDLVTEHYRLLSDDMGGPENARVADWLKENLKSGENVASDIGPLFAYVYGGTVLYVREVPAGYPFERRDISPPDLVRKMAEKNVRYLVLGITSDDPAPALSIPAVPIAFARELKAIGVTQDEVQRLRLAALFKEHYTYPEPHDGYMAVFEVLP